MTSPFPKKFWLSQTVAYERAPGETVEWLRTTEEADIPYVTATGRFLLVRTSTDNETIQLHNAAKGGRDSMNAASLPEWPWTPLLDPLPSRTGFLRHAFTYPGQAPGKASDDAA